MEPDRTRARELARQSIEAGDPAGWFEQLYRESQEGLATIPWDDAKANPNLTEWWSRDPFPAAGRTALVVGCGLGDDAEQLAAWGFQVTAFDVAPTAIAQARARFPGSAVEYRVGDLLEPVAQQRFDFVFESYTLQALPASVRSRAMANVASFVAPGGHLLVIARARNETDEAGEMPWPLLEAEVRQFARHGLVEKSWEDYMDGSTRRFRVLFYRPII